MVFQVLGKKLPLFKSSQSCKHCKHQLTEGIGKFGAIRGRVEAGF
jgi:hypothetical protein